MQYQTPVPEIIDPVFTKTSPKRSFCMTENERFGLVFVKTGSMNSGKGLNGDIPVHEIIEPVFAKTSPKRSFCITENERFGLVFVNGGSLNSGTDD